MHVCDILAEEGDILTLRSCALLCSQLASHCQRHLFSRIAVYTYDPTGSSIRRLSEILWVRPELGDYIKSLYLSVEFRSCFNDVDLRSVLPRYSNVSSSNPVFNGALQSEVRLNTVLHSAARLEQLSLRFYLGEASPSKLTGLSLLMVATGPSGSIFGLFDSPLPCITTLRYVSLDLTFVWRPHSQSTPLFRGLFDELRRFPVHNVLENVDISVGLRDYRGWDVVGDDWLLFATIFTKESFPCLRNVRARTVIGKKGTWSADVVADISNAPFGDLVLHFDFVLTLLDYDDEFLRIECKKTV